MFSECGLKTLSTELANSTSVSHINLSGNQITAEGAIAFFKMLERNPYITAIEL